MEMLFSPRTAGLSLYLAICASRGFAADWYVNPTGGGTGTSPASPILPRYAINSASSGDRIIFDAGVYLLGTSYGLGVGITGKDLTLVGMPGGGTILDMSSAAGTINIVSGAHVVMTDMVLQNGATTWCQVWVGSHLELVRSTVQFFTSTKAMLVGDDSTARFEECRFAANNIGIVVSDGCDIEVEESTFESHAQAGIYLLNASTATRINRNAFVYNYDGVRIVPGYGDTYSLIDENGFYGNGSGVAMLSVPGGYVACDRIWYNEFYDSTSSAIYSGYGNNRADIEANWIQENRVGIFIQGTSDTIHNNVVVDSTSAGGNGIEAVSSTAKIAHNTAAYNALHGILGRSGDASRYVNNISYDNTGHGIRIVGSAAAQVGYNDTYLNAVNLSGAFASLGGHRFAAPGFAGAYDFHLNTGSPLINAASWPLFPEYRDYDKKTRTPGASDMGAFEF